MLWRDARLSRELAEDHVSVVIPIYNHTSMTLSYLFDLPLCLLRSVFAWGPDLRVLVNPDHRHDICSRRTLGSDTRLLARAGYEVCSLSSWYFADRSFANVSPVLNDGAKARGVQCISTHIQ